MKQSLKVALFIMFLATLAVWSARAQVVVKQTDTVFVVHDTIYVVDTVYVTRPDTRISMNVGMCNFWPDCNFYGRPYYTRPIVLMPFNGHVYRPEPRRVEPPRMPFRGGMMNRPDDRARDRMMNRPDVTPRTPPMDRIIPRPDGMRGRMGGMTAPPAPQAKPATPPPAPATPNRARVRSGGGT